MTNVRQLLAKGQAEQDRLHDEAEVLKRGNLRGGSAGVVGTDGLMYGECHRVALARLLGADKEHPGDRSIMFDAGLRNEDSWALKLQAAGVTFKREDEIAIRWQVPGTDKYVTGRPDIVIGDWVTQEFRNADGTEMAFEPLFVPTMGLELKGVFSASTGVGVSIEGTPQTKHLCQAGFYSMALGGLPYTLCYTNPSVIEVPYWAQKKLGAPKKLQPFYRLFELSWAEDGTLLYRDETKQDWVRTVITQQGIADYYKLVATMPDTKDLGPRLSGGKADGTPAPYNPCNYCDLAAACSTYDDTTDYDAWLAEIGSPN